MERGRLDDGVWLGRKAKSTAEELVGAGWVWDEAADVEQAVSPDELFFLVAVIAVLGSKGGDASAGRCQG